MQEAHEVHVAGLPGRPPTDDEALEMGRRLWDAIHATRQPPAEPDVRAVPPVTTGPDVRVERKVRRGVEYLRVVLPSFETGEPELVLDYWRDGRVSLGSADVGLLLRRLHLHRTGCSVELQRVPLPVSDPSDEGP